MTLLEGFSGIGKSELARQIFKAWSTPKVIVSVSSDAADLDSVLFDAAAQLESAGCAVMADQADGDYRTGMLDLLDNDSLVVIDNFNELLDPESRQADESFLELALQILDRNGSGRVLLVSDHSPNVDSWLDGVEIKTMAPPDKTEAEMVLHRMLKSRGLEDEIPPESVSDVVTWLGRNPRAMQAFVACLRDAPLEELIELDADAWDIKDEVVSRNLVSRLEHLFLSKTIGRLDPKTLIGMESIAVYRKPFTQDAMVSAMPTGLKAEKVKEDLSSRFLLSRDRRWYQLNPVARQMALSDLAQDTRRGTAAHHRAADHYLKRTKFEKPQDQVTAGGNFIEARFHLLISGRDSDYQDLAGRYRRLILRNYRNVTSIPGDDVARENLLRTLNAVLDDDLSGYGRMRGLLARLLVQRNRSGDPERGLRQITLATRESNEIGDWMLRIDLSVRFESPRTLASVVTQALERLTSNHAVRVAVRAVDLLFERGYEEIALEVLNDTISRVPIASRAPLYTTAGYLLHRESRTREAVDYLVQGYQALGSKTPYSYRLFEQALFLGFQLQDQGRISSVRRMIVADPLNIYQPMLCDVVILQLTGNYGQAAKLASSGSRDYFALASQGAFCALADGDPRLADELLSDGNFKSNSSSVWLRGLVALCLGSMEVYEECMRETGASSVENLDTSDRFAWLRIWDYVPSQLGVYPAFYFPCLPQGLTGLDFEIRKHGRESVALDQLDLARLRIPSRPLAEFPDEVASQALSMAFNQKGDNIQMATNYNFNAPGVYGAVGDNSSAGSAQFTQDARQVNVPPELIDELRTLVVGLKQSQDSAEHVEEITALQGAIEAGEGGDRASMVRYLSKGGKWLLDKASDIGAKLAFEAIKQGLSI